jgi:Ca2+-binding RTX toxin-like protein
VEGGDGDDIITTAGGNDTIDGGAGDDTIDAGAGDDIIIGGPFFIAGRRAICRYRQ